MEKIIIQRVQKDGHTSLFSRAVLCVWVDSQLTRARYFQVFDEIEQ